MRLTLEQVKQQIQSRLANERRQQQYEQFADALKNKSNFKLDEKALSQFEVDLKAPSPTAAAR